jgi:hypothetical protein
MADAATFKREAAGRLEEDLGRRRLGVLDPSADDYRDRVHGLWCRPSSSSSNDHWSPARAYRSPRVGSEHWSPIRANRLGNRLSQDVVRPQRAPEGLRGLRDRLSLESSDLQCR